jgi:hypothetical protein
MAWRSAALNFSAGFDLPEVVVFAIFSALSLIGTQKGTYLL